MKSSDEMTDEQIIHSLTAFLGANGIYTHTLSTEEIVQFVCRLYGVHGDEPRSVRNAVASMSNRDRRHAVLRNINSFDPSLLSRNGHNSGRLKRAERFNIRHRV